MRLFVGALALLMAAGAVAQPGPESWPRHTLEPDAVWQLNLPDREPFEASALLWQPGKGLFTLSNRGPEVFLIQGLETAGEADPRLDVRAFPRKELQRVAPIRNGRYDCEGLAQDDQGRLYLCEESQRWILRWDPATGRVERLPIDWEPVRRFFSKNRNASFEGIAIGGGRLYVANERDQGRIIEVDLATLQVVGSFEVRTRLQAPWDVHYSDLSWFDAHLYVLCRESRTVLQVDPARHEVVAEYSFAALELRPEWRYRKRVALVGIMEGLAVEREWIWLVTDNNDMPRLLHPKDRRPTLFRCPRPDAVLKAPGSPERAVPEKDSGGGSP